MPQWLCGPRTADRWFPVLISLPWYPLRMWLLLLAFPLLSGCDSLRAIVLKHYPQDYRAVEVGAAGGASAAGATPLAQWPAGVPGFTAGDENRPRIDIMLTQHGSG
jgi:hypothetical protein